MLLADKYNAKGLIRICRETLIEILKPDHHYGDSSNIVKAAILGYQLNDKLLMEAAMKCMVERELSLKELEDWETLKEYPELMSDMFDYHSSAVINKLWIAESQ